MKNIFFWANGGKNDKPGFRRAVQIAEENKASLTVIGVVKDSPQTIFKLTKGDESIDLQAIIVDEMSRYLKNLVKSHKQITCKLMIKVLFGTPFFAIIQEVLKKKCDLVIASAKEITGVNEIIFGANAMHLMRKCPCPVLVLKLTAKRKIKKILVAVDVDAETKEELKLNGNLMEYALKMASLDSAEVHVVHIWSIYGEYYLWNYGRLEDKEVEKIINETEDLHRKKLTALIKKHAPQLPGKNIHLIKGSASDLIPEVAVKMKADLIVMGTLGRSGVQGFFIGNTAEKVLQHVDCSVLAMKPDGFVSPVQVS